MTILSFLQAQKTHIIYGAVILVLTGVAYRLFVRQPATITQTKVVTQVVIKTVIQRVLVHDNVVTNRVTETKKPDGTDTKVTETVVDRSVSQSSKYNKNTQQSSVSTQTVTSFLAKYTLTVMYPITLGNILNPTFSASNTEIILGYRLGDTPILLNCGTTFGLNTLFLGITLEL